MSNERNSIPPVVRGPEGIEAHDIIEDSKHNALRGVGLIAGALSFLAIGIAVERLQQGQWLSFLLLAAWAMAILFLAAMVASTPTEC